MAIEGIGERPDLVRPVEKIAQTHNNRSPQQNEQPAEEKEENKKNNDDKSNMSPFQKKMKEAQEKAQEEGGWVG